jgi:hypothetical protein
MAKLKAARRGKSRAAAPQGGLPCVILLILGIVLVMVFLFLVMKYAGG